MKTVLFAGYPKSGNTLIGHSFLYAGKEADPTWDYCDRSHKCDSNSPSKFYDVYQMQRIPPANPLFGGSRVCVKTHQYNLYSENLTNSYFGGVGEVITIVRNPFDTLLSGLNYFRVQWAEYGGLPQVSAIALNRLMPEYDYTRGNFLEDMKIDTLREKTHLDDVLYRFASSGTVFYNFYVTSGPWCNFAKSYDSAEVPVLSIKYEDLVDNQESTSNIISDFLQVDRGHVLSGFKKQAEFAKEKKKSGDSFYSKMKTGYWKNYFSKKACREFIDMYHRPMTEMGYCDIIEEVFDI